MCRECGKACREQGCKGCGRNSRTVAVGKSVGGGEWIEEWRSRGVRDVVGFPSDRMRRCRGCGIPRPKEAVKPCPLCAAPAGAKRVEKKPRPRKTRRIGNGHASWGCSRCGRRGHGRDSSCPSLACKGVLNRVLASTTSRDVIEAYGAIHPAVSQPGFVAGVAETKDEDGTGLLSGGGRRDMSR